MRQKKFKITEKDYILANRRAARIEEIERHGHPVQSRKMVHKSKKVYDRKRMKRAVIKGDDGSFFGYFSLILHQKLNHNHENHPRCCGCY